MKLLWHIYLYGMIPAFPFSLLVLSWCDTNGKVDEKETVLTYVVHTLLAAVGGMLTWPVSLPWLVGITRARERLEDRTQALQDHVVRMKMLNQYTERTIAMQHGMIEADDDEDRMMN